MAIPTRPRIKEALVEFIRLQGGSSHSITPRDAYKGLAASFNLTKEDLEIERDSETFWPNEVRWARQELVAEGILLPRDVSGYGIWQLAPNDYVPVQQSHQPPLPVHKTEIDQLYKDLADEGVFDPRTLSDAREIELRAIVQRRGQQNFRDLLLNEYNKTCAVTGEKCTAVLEAAHIVPYSGAQTNHAQNGLLLRADIHTLFDLYLIAIDSSYCISVAPTLSGSGYTNLEGKTLLLPTNINSHPSKVALEQHRSHCEF
jgi:hypothetical protein